MPIIPSCSATAVSTPTSASATPQAAVTPRSTGPRSNATGGAPVPTLPPAKRHATAASAALRAGGAEASNRPSRPAATIPADVRDLVLTADASTKVLKLSAIAWAGPCKTDADLFTGKLKLEPGTTICGMLAQAGVAVTAELKQLVDILNKETPILVTPRQQALLPDGSIATRIVKGGGGGGQDPDLTTWRSDLNDIAAVVHAFSREGIRVVRLMLHLDKSAPAFSAEQLLQGDARTYGFTHEGSYPPATFMASGQPMRVLAGNDYPIGYGWTLSSKHYTGVLIGVNYAHGVAKPLPIETRKAYADNANTWCCFQLPAVPFTTDDLRADERSYTFNTLDLHDQASLRTLAKLVMQGDPAAIKRLLGTNYCAEGQWNSDNLGANAIITRQGIKCMNKDGSAEFLAQGEEWTSSTMFKLIDATNRHAEAAAEAAGESLAGLSGAARDAVVEKYAKDGWAKAKEELGTAVGKQFWQALESTQHHGVLPKFAPDATLPWQAYEPLHPDGLVADPMSVPKMVQELIRNQLPREQVAAKLAEYFTGLKTTSPAVYGAVREIATKLTRIDDGDKAMAALPACLAAAQVVGILSNPAFIATLKQQAGYERIVDPDPSKPEEAGLGKKADFDALVTRFVKEATDFTLTQEQRDAKLDALDDEFKRLHFKVSVLSGSAGSVPTDVVNVGPMLYRAPASPMTSARYPDVCDSQPQTVYEYIAHTLPAEFFA